MNTDDRAKAHPAGDADPARRRLLTGGAGLGAAAIAALLADAGVTLAQGVQDPTLTAEQMLGKVLRVYHTGDALTMDYSEDRLNIELGADDRVVRVWIG